MEYVVKLGDTLGKIAALHNTTVAALAQANNIANPNLILVGQRLRIPTGTSSGPWVDPMAFEKEFGAPPPVNTPANAAAAAAARAAAERKKQQESMLMFGGVALVALVLIVALTE